MSRLTDITKEAAIRALERLLPRFGDLDGLGVSAEMPLKSVRRRTS